MLWAAFYIRAMLLARMSSRHGDVVLRSATPGVEA